MAAAGEVWVVFGRRFGVVYLIVAALNLVVTECLCLVVHLCVCLYLVLLVPLSLSSSVVAVDA